MNRQSERVVGQPPVQVLLRPIGSPLTIGAAGLAVASFVQSGFDLSWLPRSEAAQLGLVMIAVPFVLQGLASIFSYLARDGAAGTSAGILATTWLTLGLFHVTSPGRTSDALGLLLLSSGVVLGLSAVAVCSGKPLPGALFSIAAVRFILSGVYELSNQNGWQRATGVLGLAVCALAGYTLLAFELESQRRHPLLPTFRRARGEAALYGGWGEQIEGVVHEPGVRQTT